MLLVARFAWGVYNKSISMAEEKKQEAEKTTTVLVHEEEQKKSFPIRLVLIYILLLASGLFLGILFAYFLRR